MLKDFFNCSNYKLHRPLPKEKNRKDANVMKNELGGKTRKETVTLRAKTHNYYIDDGSED